MRKALLLAAGLGTRLHPLTKYMPKCLVPIRGVPLLVIWIKILEDAGFSEVLINTHYFSELVEKALVSARKNFKIKISTVYESKLLGTCGTISNNVEFFKGAKTLAFIHSDNLCYGDFSAFVQSHESSGSNYLLTMMTFKTDTPRSCGVLELENDGKIKSFHEKVENPPTNLANGAIYLAKSEFLDTFQKELSKAFDITAEIIPLLLDRIKIYHNKNTHLDVGNILNLFKAQGKNPPSILKAFMENFEKSHLIQKLDFEKLKEDFLSLSTDKRDNALRPAVATLEGKSIAILENDSVKQTFFPSNSIEKNRDFLYLYYEGGYYQNHFNSNESLFSMKNPPLILNTL